jgi:hypothetical protein
MNLEKGTDQMSDDINAQVEAELQAQIERELQAELARKRMEIARRLRREAEMKEYDRINARHPIQGPGDPKVEAARRAAMDKRAAEDMAWMDRVNARPVAGSLAATRADQKGGSSGFEIKRSPR